VRARPARTAAPPWTTSAAKQHDLLFGSGREYGTSLMRTPEELTERFRELGLKVTPQRQGVFHALWGDQTHPAAEAIWDRVRLTMPTVSLRTVYQVLNDLVELGEIHPVRLGTASVRFDPNMGPHDHFVCGRCSTVLDVHASAVVEFPADQHPDIEVEATQIVFRGRCPDCARIGATSH
jgi:Fe2+ or Zn2+ uptake regulation protein